MNKTRNAGFTLIEASIVIAIVLLIAAALAPALAPNDDTYVQAGADVIVFSLNSAREAAIREQAVYGVEVDAAAGVIRVFAPDLLAVPIDTSADYTDPVSKRALRHAIGEGALINGLAIDNAVAPFVFEDVGPQGTVLFDRFGIPYWYDSSVPQGYRMTSAAVILSRGLAARTISIDPITGLVTQQ